MLEETGQKPTEEYGIEFKSEMVRLRPGDPHPHRPGWGLAQYENGKPKWYTQEAYLNAVACRRSGWLEKRALEVSGDVTAIATRSINRCRGKDKSKGLICKLTVPHMVSIFPESGCPVCLKVWQFPWLRLLDAPSIDKLFNDFGFHFDDNCWWICFHCNTQKSDMNIQDYLTYLSTFKDGDRRIAAVELQMAKTNALLQNTQQESTC